MLHFLIKLFFQLKGGGIKTPDPDWSRNREGRSIVASRQNSPPEIEPTITIQRSRRGSRLGRQHSYDDEVKNNLVQIHQTESGLNLPPQMPRRASAYDVFAIPGSVVPNSSQNRRASFKIPCSTENTSLSPEQNVAALGTPEDDRRTRRRGSQL